MELLRKIARYILGPIIDQHVHAFRPSDGWGSMLTMYKDVYVKTWMVRGLIGVLFCYCLSKVTGNEYFYLAIKQVLSPLFWNVVSSIGILFALIAIIFKVIHIRFISNYFLNSSQAFLCFASELGALMYGVIIGILIIATLNSDLSHFKIILLVSGGIIGLFIILILNLLVWWLAFCIKNQDKSPLYFIYAKDKKVLMFLVSFVGFVAFTYIVITTTPNN